MFARICNFLGKKYISRFVLMALFKEKLLLCLLLKSALNESPLITCFCFVKKIIFDGKSKFKCWKVEDTFLSFWAKKFASIVIYIFVTISTLRFFLSTLLQHKKVNNHPLQLLETITTTTTPSSTTAASS